MTLKINQAVSATVAAPIAEAAAWPCAVDMAPIDLAQAVPNYDPAPELLDYLSKAVRDARSAFYTPILGLPQLREALAADLSKEYSASIEARDVTITTGCNHAFCMATSALAGPGDEIILPEPFYFNHDMWFTMQGIRKVTLPCHAREEGMVPDPEEAEALITPRTRAIVLISPNNPTGTIYSTERLRAFYRLAERHGLALILDETYKDFRPFAEKSDEAPHPLFQEESWPDVLIQLYSFSKAYSLTGYRVGSLIAGPKVIEAVTKIADTITICPPHIGQLAALYGLQNLKEWREEKRANMLELIAELEAAFHEHSPPFKIISKGAFFAYLEHPFTGRSSLEVAKSLMADQGLLLLPGEFFGSGQENYLRAAFANASAEQLFESARRLKGAA